MALQGQVRISRRRWMSGAVASLGAAFVPAAIRAALAAGERPPGQGVYRKDGEVRINGRPAQVGEPIRPGDAIEAGTGSQAVFIVGRDAFLIRAESRVETGGSALFIGVLRVVSGRILSVFGSGAKRIETGTALIGIRGTGIYVEAEPQRTYVCTCYGTADLQPRTRPDLRETVTTRHHEQPRYIYSEGSMPVTEMMGRAPVINHSDAELILLESLVGRTPPFGGPGNAPKYSPVR